jgi:hypothetical protein
MMFEFEGNAWEFLYFNVGTFVFYFFPDLCIYSMVIMKWNVQKKFPANNC